MACRKLFAMRRYYSSYSETRSTIFTVTHKVRVKAFQPLPFFFSLVLKHRKSVQFLKCYTILHTRLQLMWIKPVMGHYFLACNLLWPCSFIGTSDTELSGILIMKGFIFEVSSQSVKQREAEKMRHDMACTCAIVLLHNQSTSPVPCTHPNKYIKKTRVRFSSACMPFV